MKKLKKIQRNFEVNFYFNWAYGVTLDKIKKDIEELEKLGVTFLDIEAEDHYGSPYVSITAIASRLETDDEYFERKKKEKDLADRIKQQELRQLEILSAKYKTT